MATKRHISDLDSCAFWLYFNAFMIDADRRIKTDSKDYWRLAVVTDALFAIKQIAEKLGETNVHD